MWRHIAQSQTGSSHAADGSPCQDSHAIRVLGSGADETLIACVADGAGSAAHSDVGSSLACDAIMRAAEAYFAEHVAFEGLAEETIAEWYALAHKRLCAEAASRDCKPREFATTMALAIVTPTRSFFFQIGDGAIVAGRRGIYGVVFWPQSGEYANTTNFLTSEDFRTHLESVAVDGPWTEIAMFSDGLERLALQFDGQTPHVRFFAPLFAALRTVDEVDGLNDGLRQFLQSPAVQSRSDDDKTLILVARRADDVGHA